LLASEEFLRAVEQQFPELAPFEIDADLSAAGFDSFQYFQLIELASQWRPIKLSEVPRWRTLHDIVDWCQELQDGRTHADGTSVRPRHEGDDLLSLEGASVRLAPVVPADRDALFRLCLMGDAAWRWRHAGSQGRYETFIEDTQRDAHLDYAAHAGGQLVGRLLIHSLDAPNRHAHLSVVFAPEVRRSPVVAEALYLFVRYVFGTLNLRKIYSEIAGFNLDQFRSAVTTLGHEEAVLEQHIYRDSRFWDLHIFAVTSVEWDTLRHRIEALI
jgi:RimJ/RimL family protein N-acetyltransferase